MWSTIHEYIYVYVYIICTYIYTYIYIYIYEFKFKCGRTSPEFLCHDRSANNVNMNEYIYTCARFVEQIIKKDDEAYI